MTGHAPQLTFHVSRFTLLQRAGAAARPVGYRTAFGFRISDFGFRISAPPRRLVSELPDLREHYHAITLLRVGANGVGGRGDAAGCGEQITKVGPVGGDQP